tara:strand:- start:24205 stop:24414 length:210 start_codon:yes stop_codon:yes gene_type:complete
MENSQQISPNIDATVGVAFAGAALSEFVVGSVSFAFAICHSPPDFYRTTLANHTRLGLGLQVFCPGGKE